VVISQAQAHDFTDDLKVVVDVEAKVETSVMEAGCGGRCAKRSCRSREWMVRVRASVAVCEGRDETDEFSFGR
jgi:hypothetical protein